MTEQKLMIDISKMEESNRLLMQCIIDEKESIAMYKKILDRAKITDLDRWFYTDMIQSSRENIEFYINVLKQ